MKDTKRTKALISEYFIFVIFIALVVVLTCLKPSFIQPGNLVNILKQASINGILAFGMMYPNAPLYLFFVPVPVKAKWMVAGMIAIELLIGLSESAGRSDGIAHFAHLGGMIFGFIMIWFWKKKGTLHGGY